MIPDYPERVYAGVLGKIIGVYLGRPFEGWSYERISAELGYISGYVHERLGQPLVVTDDDIAGTFTFLRALHDYGYPADLSPAQIGQSWLNYIIEGRTVLWWGGMGNSTEHTAYLRLKNGLTAPASGSIAVNGPLVAQQIGAQIFIDGWAMCCPGDPERAADLARRAASVSHDGEAVYAAQALAAMEALAFVESDLNRLLDTALAVIPPESVIARLYHDMRGWHAAEPDWRMARARLAERYGYRCYGGNCHVVPNHALILLGLLYGAGDLRESLGIACTAGWDTDCNAGNLGCLLGLRNGLAAFASLADLRAPVADRLYLPTADGGRAISDAVQETYQIVNAGRALAGLPPLAPKNGARFHFELPGSVQGWQASNAVLENVPGHSASGSRSLALHYRLAHGETASASTATFSTPEALALPGYELLASPTLHPGQRLHARISAADSNPYPLTCGLFVQLYGEKDALTLLHGPTVSLPPGGSHVVRLDVPDTGGHPIGYVGLHLLAPEGGHGSCYLDYLTWDGAPRATYTRPASDGDMWRRAWVPAIDKVAEHAPESFRIVQNRGTGLLIQGGRDWRDYRVSASITPHMALAAGLAARVQGLQRYYALLLQPGNQVQLLKMLDGPCLLASAPFTWHYGGSYQFQLDVSGDHLQASLDGQPLFDLHDADSPLLCGGIALVCTEGCISTDAVEVTSSE